MSDHPSETAQIPTAAEVRAGQAEQFRQAMQETMATMNPAQLEAAGDMAGILNQRSE